MPVLTGCEFGDIIKNNNLSRDNPKQVGIYLWENGVMHLADEFGNKWEVPNDKGANLEIIHFTNFGEYMAECREKLKAVK